MKLLVPVFSLTLFLSAFLLFGIQPLFSKMVLPYLGGSPMVWNTAMVFFQAVLLAGYGYAFFSSKIPKVWIQVLLHSSLFLLFVIFLPFAISASDIPSDIENPAFWQIGLMLSVIGGPFFIISGCAPLLQRWFSRTGHPNAHNPYFLYAASNIGSMLALLSYPFVTEPLLGVQTQVIAWSYLYGALIFMVSLCGLLTIWNAREVIIEATAKVTQTIEKITWGRRGLWIVLSFIPSSLMLGVTTYMTTDIASVPLLWILPLAIYVGTFIVAFSEWRPFGEKGLNLSHSLVLLMILMLSLGLLNVPIEIKIIAHILAFTVIALSCHISLTDFKPSPTHLTEFYFFMSLGGVLGGIFNALVAPLVFTGTWEYTLILLLSALFINPKAMIEEIKQKNFFSKNMVYVGAFIIGALFILLSSQLSVANGFIFTAFLVGSIIIIFFCYNLRFAFFVLLTLMFFIYPVHRTHDAITGKKVLFTERNFFGTTRVIQENGEYQMIHGTTLHGFQFADEERRLETVAYYNPKTSIGEAFTHFTDVNPKKNVGVLGLGTGGLACYTMPGREFDFYDIDPTVKSLTTEHNYFSYLKDCGNPYEIIMGDGRLKVSQMPDKYYDFLVVDVFSSDNIPVHLLTKEAIEIYLSKLKDDGVLLIHITNRHMELTPVLATISKNLNVSMLYKFTQFYYETVMAERIYPTRTVLIAKDKAVLEPLEKQGWEKFEDIHPRYFWTDDYVNIVGVLKIFKPFFSDAASKEEEADEK